MIIRRTHHGAQPKATSTPAVTTTQKSDSGKKYLPAETHQLVIAIARHDRLHHREHEEHEAELEQEPDQDPASR